MSADDSLRKAAARLAEIHDEIEILQAEAREIDAALAVMRRFGAWLPTEESVAEPTPQKETVVPDLFQQRSAHSMSQAEFEVLATQLIERENRPLNRSEILFGLAGIGKPLGGDAGKNAGTKLWRARDKFVNIRGAGYWFRDRPLPALGYDPDDPRDPGDLGESAIDAEAEAKAEIE